MPLFKAPQYSKMLNPKSGNSEPCYTFPIEFENNEEILSFVAESQEQITLQSLQVCVIDNVNWWNEFIQQFLKASSKLFSKPYTVETINRITKHTLDGLSPSSFPVNVSVKPKNIQIFGGIFTVNWTYVTEQIIISIPDLSESQDDGNKNTSLPVSNITIHGMEELNMDELPVSNNSTVDTLDIGNPLKTWEKQQIKHARLKAKLALYKAQLQMAAYHEKYGDDISDSDSDFESSDIESEEGGGESGEEVQL